MISASEKNVLLESSAEIEHHDVLSHHGRESARQAMLTNSENISRTIPSVISSTSPLSPKHLFCGCQWNMFHDDTTNQLMAGLGKMHQELDGSDMLSHPENLLIRDTDRIWICRLTYCVNFQVVKPGSPSTIF